MWADMGYVSKQLQSYLQSNYNIDLEIVKRPPKRMWISKDDLLLNNMPELDTGFKIQPKRWIVERTFGWLNRYRRLAKEYDSLTDSSTNFIFIALNRLMLARLLTFS